MQDLPPLVRITAVEVVSEHELRLTFEDGTVGDVAFDDSEWRGRRAPPDPRTPFGTDHVSTRAITDSCQSIRSYLLCDSTTPICAAHESRDPEAASKQLPGRHV